MHVCTECDCFRFIHPFLFFITRVKKKENDKDEDIKEEEREPKDRRCFQCGDTGHVRRDCPEYRHLKQRTVSAPGIRRGQPHRIFLYDVPYSISVIMVDTHKYTACLASSSPVSHTVRTIASSQSIPIPQAPADSPGRTRQPSECVSTKKYF